MDRGVIWGLSLAALLLCPMAAAQRNVLLIIGDDVGVDLVGAYGEHPHPASTPVLDQLAADGILFRNAWSLPTCSPTRAALLTGRMPYQTGIGRAMYPVGDKYEVALAETTVAELLGCGWHKAAVGKWHMEADQISGLMHPLLQGFDTHRGAPWNLPDSTPSSYFDFQKAIDGQLGECTTYATTDSVNEALDLISQYSEPWFIWLAFNASHTPFHDPPHDLHSEVVPHDPSNDVPAANRAAVQAMDTEIGRLLDGIDPDVLSHTVVIFIGDNGTHPDATTPPFDPAHAKGSIYEGGINVPLIIAGRGVQKGAECAGLVQATDVFATILDIAGIAPPPGTTGVSLGPYLEAPLQPTLRPWVYSERFKPNGFGPYEQHQRAVRDVRYKLIRDLGDGDSVIGESLFDLADDPFETTDLLGGQLTASQQSSYAALSAVLDGIVPPWLDLGHALPGAFATPELEGGGTLLPGDKLELELEKAPKLKTAWMIVGGAKLMAPFKGGVLVPDPTVLGLVLPFQTNTFGRLNLIARWPAGLPAGFQLYIQFWMMTPYTESGWMASNALQLTTP